ncbi:ABC transporter ATP-binding protein [Bradyrhizobium sp. dw_78]|uniref:ABC transporter ATP-binding protein n=1 Tax=Bradyrhizobium sp. dw_78 TaxID=2719793 RepID=UPI001BD57AB6|nr:ABC transporter ATP-binding protein [Bradyrhizobium sp. dw_78]
MSEDAVTVENLSKSYLIGHRHTSKKNFRYKALRDVIGQEIRNFARKAAAVARGQQIVQGDEIEEFAALSDVNFSVKQGEVLGIIGRNGAGKSTLLKILSRITEPSKGRVILRGRVSSLLEVGTGFHPELTGQENIFLNGAVLGMSRREIRRKFDEIVAFAEVEKFLDTPVKHYSSGMYVRLAFAVAAHLEPEILIVDEVLAVGDAEFQKKCLGKMNEVSRNQGRTVLFVSHNMDAVLKLCTRAVFFESGRVKLEGDVEPVVSHYLSSQSASARLVDLSSKPRPDYIAGGRRVRLVQASPSNSESSWSLPFGQRLSLDLAVDAESSVNEIEVFVEIYSLRGFEVATWSNTCSGVKLPLRPGINTFRIGFPELSLLPGHYFIGISLVGKDGIEDYINEAIFFEVVSSAEAVKINAQVLGGALVPSATVSILD